MGINISQTQFIAIDDNYDGCLRSTAWGPDLRKPACKHAEQHNGRGRQTTMVPELEWNNPATMCQAGKQHRSKQSDTHTHAHLQRCDFPAGTKTRLRTPQCNSTAARIVAGVMPPQADTARPGPQCAVHQSCVPSWRGGTTRLPTSDPDSVPGVATTPRRVSLALPAKDSEINCCILQEVSVGGQSRPSLTPTAFPILASSAKSVDPSFLAPGRGHNLPPSMRRMAALDTRNNFDTKATTPPPKASAAHSDGPRPASGARSRHVSGPKQA